MTQKKINAHSIWISDIHLGSIGSKHMQLLSFLNNIECSNLFFNGDTIEKCLIKNINSFNKTYAPIIHAIDALKKKGTHIYMLTGNHDSKEDLRNFFPKSNIQEELIYHAKNNKKYLVFHGHSIDTSVRLRNNIIGKMGTQVYEWIQSRDHKKNKKISHLIKKTVKTTFRIVFLYYKKLIAYSKNANVDGVIFGHTHTPFIKSNQNLDLLNSGDWTKNCTYITECNNGHFSLQSWKCIK